MLKLRGISLVQHLNANISSVWQVSARAMRVNIATFINVRSSSNCTRTQMKTQGNKGNTRENASYCPKR